MPEANVTLTLEEAKGIRVALIFGVPDPMPAELKSAIDKLGRAQMAMERTADA